MTRFKSDPCSYVNHERHVATSKRVGDGTVVGREEDCQELFAYLWERFFLLKIVEEIRTNGLAITNLGRCWKRDTHGIQRSEDEPSTQKVDDEEELPSDQARQY